MAKAAESPAAPPPAHGDTKVANPDQPSGAQPASESRRHSSDAPERRAASLAAALVRKTSTPSSVPDDQPRRGAGRGRPARPRPA